MKRKLLAPSLETHLDVRSEQFHKNRSDMLEQLEELDELLDEAEAGGGPETTKRHRSYSVCAFFIVIFILCVCVCLNICIY